MKERPIIFSAPMVRAILEGRKFQTRRIMKKAFDKTSREWASAVCPAREYGWIAWFGPETNGIEEFTQAKYEGGFPCSYGEIGERLWVRETSAMVSVPRGTTAREIITVYRANNPQGLLVPNKWTPSIFMPRWASRISLEITNIRAERVQKISAKDVIAEGLGDLIDILGLTEHHAQFEHAWKEINGAESWDENCWVWVIEFKRI